MERAPGFPDHVNGVGPALFLIVQPAQPNNVDQRGYYCLYLPAWISVPLPQQDSNPRSRAIMSSTTSFQFLPAATLPPTSSCCATSINATSRTSAMMASAPFHRTKPPCFVGKLDTSLLQT
jgi:hypothetical protein